MWSPIMKSLIRENIIKLGFLKMECHSAWVCFSFTHAEHFLLNMHSNQTKSPTDVLFNFLFKTPLSILNKFK